MRPPGPVCGVTRFIPRIFEASCAASSAERASFTPPPLPRPPAWICAFTTTTGVPSFWATLRASSGAGDHLTARGGNAKAAKNLLSLIFVNFHGRYELGETLSIYDRPIYDRWLKR